MECYPQQHLQTALPSKSPKAISIATLALAIVIGYLLWFWIRFSNLFELGASCIGQICTDEKSVPGKVSREVVCSSLAERTVPEHTAIMSTAWPSGIYMSKRHTVITNTLKNDWMNFLTVVDALIIITRGFTWMRVPTIAPRPGTPHLSWNFWLSAHTCFGVLGQAQTVSKILHKALHNRRTIAWLIYSLRLKRSETLWNVSFVSKYHRRRSCVRKSVGGRPAPWWTTTPGIPATKFSKCSNVRPPGEPKMSTKVIIWVLVDQQGISSNKRNVWPTKNENQRTNGAMLAEDEQSRRKVKSLSLTNSINSRTITPNSNSSIRREHFYYYLQVYHLTSNWLHQLPFYLFPMVTWLQPRWPARAHSFIGAEVYRINRIMQKWIIEIKNTGKQTRPL